MSVDTAIPSATSATSVRTPCHALERAGPGESAARFDRGDFVLVAGDHFNSWLIRLGQGLRSVRVREADDRYVKWTHAALLVDRDGCLIEAVGPGVRRWHLDHYRGDDYVVVRLQDVSDEDRDQVVRFAESVVRRRARYSRLQTVSMGLSLLTGSRLTFFIDGQFVCSGLVACALQRTGAIFDRDAARITPAYLARYFHADRFVAEPPFDPAAPAGRPQGDGTGDVTGDALSTARTSSARERIPSLR